MRKYTRDEFITAVRSSRTIREALLKLGLHPAGGSYEVFHRNVKLWGVDTSHFITSRRGYYVGQTPTPKDHPIEDYLSNRLPIPSSRLRDRLIKSTILSARCSRCGITTWLDGPAPLELHHRDGNHHNNNLTNLEILCSNCHAQTETYCRRKTQENQEKTHARKHPRQCKMCGIAVCKASTFCRQCAALQRGKLTKLNPELIGQEVQQLGYEAVGRKYGTTGNAVKKFLARQGVTRE